MCKDAITAVNSNHHSSDDGQFPGDSVYLIARKVVRLTRKLARAQNATRAGLSRMMAIPVDMGEGCHACIDWVYFLPH